MPNKRYMCRTHNGGVFSIPPRKGRPPVRCTEQYPCDKVNTASTSNRGAIAARVGASEASNRAKQLAKSITRPAEPAVNPNVPLAMAAKAQLEAVGWLVKGKAFIDDEGTPYVHLVASRGPETLVIEWQNGKLLSQQYALEFIKPSENGYPARQLSFDPAELTDSELVRMIRGMKVQWWNTIASSTETAVIGDKVTIEHMFFTSGDEDNTKRIVKFIDHSGGGFRAFHVSALLKVG